MSALVQRRLCALLVSAVVGFSVWFMIPGTPLDRAAFEAVAGSFTNPPLFVSGNGRRETPWALRAFTTGSKPDPRQAPLVVSLGDDPDGFFQSSPPAPIDLAVVLSNFYRLGAKKVATAAVLAWEAPDPIGLAALEKSLGRFDSQVMATPLSRGAAAASMPPAYRRASVPLSAAVGDISSLPVVNRVPIPGVILPGAKALAGFSVLESEKPARFLPLMARWEDRLVFSFALLTVLQRLDLPPSGVEIRLGQYLKLGRTGPIVPIDAYGRLALPLKPIVAYAEISAEALIDGGDDLFPKQAPDPVILRDDRSAADPSVRSFSRSLAVHIAALASGDGVGPVREFPRLREDQEIGLLATIAAGLSLLCGARSFTRHVGAGVMTGALVAAQWIGLGMASVWLPGVPACVAILAAVVVCPFVRQKVPPPSPVRKVAEKAAAKTVVTEKTAAKKAPARNRAPELPPPEDPS